MNDAEAAEIQQYLRPIEALLHRFAVGDTPPDQFENEFFPAYARLAGDLSDGAFTITEWLFGIVEDWNADELLNDDGAVSTAELRKRIAELLACINQSNSPAATR